MKLEEALNSLHTDFPELKEEVGAGQPVEASDFSDSDTERAIRQTVIAELDAINMYTQLADSIENEDLKNLLKQVAKEEEVHVGEFEKALETISPDTTDNVADGKEEAGRILGNSGSDEEVAEEEPKEDEESLEEAFNRLYVEFPELREAGPVGAFTGSLVKQGLQKLPIIGNAMNAYQANKQQPAATTAAPAPAPAPAPAKTGGIGGAIGKAVAAASNAKMQKQGTMNALATAGQTGPQILDNIKAALTTFVGAPEPAAPQQPTNTVPTEGVQKDQAAAGAAQGGAAPIPESKKTYASILNELYSFEDTHLLEGNKQQIAALKKAAQTVLTAMGTGDSSTWANNKTVVDGIKKIIQGSQQFKVDMGLQGITPEMVDQAVTELAQPVAPEVAAPAAPAAPQQTVQQMNPDQIAAVISGMDRRVLKKLVQDNPDLAQQVVAAMGKPQAQQ